MRAADAPRVCISIHDVAPQTWSACSRLLELTDSFGAVPVTLLVVPDYHHGGRIERFPRFLQAVERRLARGDEVALHGYCHLDEAPAPRTPLAWVRRRVLTRSEGEFAALAGVEAARRLQDGLQLMHALRWPVQGFVAPAWLPGAGARAVLGELGFSYTSTRAGLYRLPAWQFTWCPSLVYSVGARWRHALSESLDALAQAATRGREIVRVSLHPVDADCPSAMRHWKQVVGSLLASRFPVTKGQWACSARPNAACLMRVGP